MMLTLALHELATNAANGYCGACAPALPTRSVDARMLAPLKLQQLQSRGSAHGSSVNNFISRIEGPNIVAVNIFAV
jgi:hypothetical protein